MTHFEKPGHRAFRRLGVSGARVTYEVGQPAEFSFTASARFASAGAAAKWLARWSQLARDAGFASAQLPEGAVPGIVRAVTAPEGPARVRTDAPDDVYLPSGAAKAPLKVGQRVVLLGVKPSKQKLPDWMFGSSLAAASAEPFPKLEKTSPAPGPDAKARKALLQLAGPKPVSTPWSAARRDLPKTKGKLELGTLMFTYNKGIHRYLGASKKTGADREKLVVYEPVLTATLERANSLVPLTCAREFCEPIPKALQAALEKHFGPL